MIFRTRMPKNEVFDSFKEYRVNVPSAYQKAIYHYTQTIDLARETGAIGIKAQAHLDLGIIHKIKNRNDLAKEHLQKAINIFEEIGAFRFLKQANKELNQL